jgi:hypothetical protein
MSTKLSAGRVRSTYEFIKTHRDQYSVQVMCRILGVAPSGYYKWLAHPISSRAKEDARLLRLIRASFTSSQGIYGAPRVFLELREAGETCSKRPRRPADARESPARPARLSHTALVGRQATVAAERWLPRWLVRWLPRTSHRRALLVALKDHKPLSQRGFGDGVVSQRLSTGRRPFGAPLSLGEGESDPPFFASSRPALRGCRRPHAGRGRSPLRPGVSTRTAKRRARQSTDSEMNRDHQDAHFRAALGAVKARRFAPPAYAARGLDRASTQPKSALT